MDKALRDMLDYVAERKELITNIVYIPHRCYICGKFISKSDVDNPLKVGHTLKSDGSEVLHYHLLCEDANNEGEK